jgi:HK97 family phage portal protein
LIFSHGVAVKTPDVIWTGSPTTWPGSLELGGHWASYGEIYRRQLWVSVVVNKLANGTARLPLKVYRRTGEAREPAADHPYAELLRRPNRRQDSKFFWLWTVSTFNIYGEAFWLKLRDPAGRPNQLVLIHPANVVSEEQRDGTVKWSFDNGTVRVDNIPEWDLVPFRTYNPNSLHRGLSPLEPLRATLENEDAARRATSSFWRNGARPGVVLSHPGKLGDVSAKRLRLQWDELLAGADNTAKTVVLEEGMKPEKLMLTAEEAQYIETRKLNREEVCAGYDTPPPVVHILDHATYSNITEQMRSMYRDTMAPKLGALEATMEHHLRASQRGNASEPDFGDEVYAEFLMDEVLRGDFEQRADSYQKAVNSGWLTINEVRRYENLTPVDGGDQSFVNSTMVPISAAGQQDEAAMLRTVLGRLARPNSLDEVDGEALVRGMNGESVLAELEAARAANEGVPALRERIKALGGLK